MMGAYSNKIFFGYCARIIQTTGLSAPKLTVIKIVSLLGKLLKSTETRKQTF